MNEPNEVIQRAYEKAKKEHIAKLPPKKTLGWGFLTGYLAPLTKEEEPTTEELFDAILAEFKLLSPAQILSLSPPRDSERIRVYVSVLQVISKELMKTCDLESVDELYGHLNVAHAALANVVGKIPQSMTEHSRMMYEWMKWRYTQKFRYDTCLFYLVEAEYQLIEAKTPGLLTQPSVDTVKQIDETLLDLGNLKQDLIKITRDDVEFLSKEVEKQTKRISELKAKDEKIGELMKGKGLL